MITAACLLLTLTVVAAAPQPTPTPSQSPTFLSPQHILSAPFTNCIQLDISEIEELRWKLNKTIDFEFTGKKEMISFGLLEEDWFRLKLLEDRLPVDSILKPKLLKLFRLVISAVFQAHKLSVKHPEPNDELFENNQLNRTELNLLNISNDLLKPMRVSESNIFSESTTIADGIDNEAAESELQESVLPFNTFASPYIIETTTTVHPNHADLKLNFSKEVKRGSTYITLPTEISTHTYSGKYGNSNNEYTTNYEQTQNNTQKYDPMITENYQDFEINYVNELGAASEETKGDKTNKEEEPEKVKFVEEYDDIITPVTDGNKISVIEVESVSGTEITNITTVNEENTSQTNLETESSTFEDVEDRNNKSYVVDETAEISNEATFTPETNKNQIEFDEKGHGTHDDDFESRGEVSEVITTVSNLSSYTVSSDRSLSRDSTIQPSSGQDDISQHQYTSNPTESSLSTARHLVNFDQSTIPTRYIEQKNYLTTTLSNSNYFNDKTIEIDTDSPSPVTSENNPREDGFSQSATVSPFSSTPSMNTSLNKTSHERFHSFTAVFPEYPKLAYPTIKANKLTIHSPDIRQIFIYPFKESRLPPMVQTACKNKNSCAKVQKIEFKNPQNYERYKKPNSDTSSEDIRVYKAEVESNRKSWDSENILWWHKIRSLRKKAVDR